MFYGNWRANSTAVRQWPNATEFDDYVIENKALGAPAAETNEQNQPSSCMDCGIAKNDWNHNRTKQQYKQ